MFEVIEGGKKEQEIIRCPKCQSATFIDVRHTLRRRGRTITKGVKAKACVLCLAKGDITLI